MNTPAILAELATRSILLEVSCHPKPGLVTPFSPGCHHDMDYRLFLKSSAVLSQGFAAAAALGYAFEGPPASLFAHARETGIPVERRMFSVTGGTNTQKGLVFLFQTLLAGAGRLCREERLTPGALASYVAEMTDGIVSRELAPLMKGAGRDLTKGEALYVSYGITGIRGEVEDGLPSVMKTGLPTFRRACERGEDLDAALLETLFALMTVVEDTNIMSRKGLAMYEDVKRRAADVLAKGGVSTPEGMEAISAFSSFAEYSHISPGGSADLLSATLFMHYLDTELPWGHEGMTRGQGIQTEHREH